VRETGMGRDAVRSSTLLLSAGFRAEVTIHKKLFHYMSLSTIGRSGMMSFGAWMHAAEEI
jgi:hypothetical protein